MSQNPYQDLLPVGDPLRTLQDENTKLKQEIIQKDDRLKNLREKLFQAGETIKENAKKVSTVLFSFTARFNDLHTGTQSGWCGGESAGKAAYWVQANHGHVRVYRQSGKGRRENGLPQRKMRGACQDVLPEYRSEDERGLCREVEQICSQHHFMCAAALRLQVLQIISIRQDLHTIFIRQIPQIIPNHPTRPCAEIKSPMRVFSCADPSKPRHMSFQRSVLAEQSEEQGHFDRSVVELCSHADTDFILPNAEIRGVDCLCTEGVLLRRV